MQSESLDGDVERVQSLKQPTRAQERVELEHNLDQTPSGLLRERLIGYKYVPVTQGPRRSLRPRNSTTSSPNILNDGVDQGIKPNSLQTRRLRRYEPRKTVPTSANGDPQSPPASTMRQLRRTRSIDVPTRTSTKKPADHTRYAHLAPLVDILTNHLLLVFVGVNPGITTSISGHAYAHPSNRFWHLLHASGLTPERKLSPTEDRTLPSLYGYGNTNIVERPSRDQSELSKQEMIAGTETLETKFRRYKPEAVCIVGKGIWEAVWRYRYGKSITKDEFHYGWQNEDENFGRMDNDEVDASGNTWKGARVFVATSTSGLAASLRPEEKLAVWRPLGEWAQRRRRERAANGIFTGSVGIDIFPVQT